MANRYTFTTTLKGYVNVACDAGKYNNRHFGYQIPADVLEQVEADRKELLKWARKKQGMKRPHVNLTPWFVDKDSVDGAASVKYSYGEGDGTRKAKPEPTWTDRDGNELDQVQREEITAGTKVELVIDQKPYAMEHQGKGFIGTSLKVVSGRCLEIVGTRAWSQATSTTNRSQGRCRASGVNVENPPVKFSIENVESLRRLNVGANVENLSRNKRAAIMENQSLINYNPMDRTLSELVGSAVVFDLQQLLEAYLPVVGNEGRNQLIQTIRDEAMEYLDQEMI